MVNWNHAPPAPPCLAARTKPHCLLCEGPAAFSNIYIPGERSPAAPPAGKHRMVLYSLCQSCAAKFDVLSSLIETKIENELRHRGTI